MEETEQKVDFEASIASLEALVKEMESGELTLEQSLMAFEKGVKLARECQSSLTEAEGRVNKLMKKMNLASSDD